MRPEFYEIYAVVYGIPIHTIGWNYFDYPVIVFVKAPHVYYYNYHDNRLEMCVDYWYLYRVKRIGSCVDVDEFTIHIIPRGIPRG